MVRAWRSMGSFCAIVVAIALGCSSAAASDSGLYRAQAVVSGQGEANRAIGMAQCLEDVLVKVSGDQRLLREPKVAVLKQEAAAFATRFQYRDRMSGIPMHDEQGSYDRPHDLAVQFDPPKIDALLRALGRQPWLWPRPHVVVYVSVLGRKDSFTLASDSDRDPDMRASLEAAAERVGLPIALPTRLQFAQEGWNVDTLPQASLAKLDEAASADHGDLALAGNLIWSDQALGWIAEWRLGSKGRAYHWQVRGVGFDDAFRNGMHGAAQVLSGNGEPE